VVFINRSKISSFPTHLENKQHSQQYYIAFDAMPNWIYSGLGCILSRIINSMIIYM